MSASPFVDRVASRRGPASTWRYFVGHSITFSHPSHTSLAVAKHETAPKAWWKKKKIPKIWKSRWKIQLYVNMMECLLCMNETDSPFRWTGESGGEPAKGRTLTWPIGQPRVNSEHQQFSYYQMECTHILIRLDSKPGGRRRRTKRNHSHTYSKNLICIHDGWWRGAHILDGFLLPSEHDVQSNNLAEIFGQFSMKLLYVKLRSPENYALSSEKSND